MRAIFIGCALVTFYAIVAITSDAGSARNQRDTNVRRLGIETIQRSAGVSVTGNAITLSPLRSGWSSARWDISSYEVSHVLNRALSCRVALFITDTDVSSSSPNGVAEITLDGKVVRRIVFSAARRGFFPLATGRYVPSNVVPALVDIVPLDRRYGFVVPLPASACARQEFIVGIRARDVDWTVSTVGLSLNYTPERMPILANAAFTVAAGAILAILLGGALFGTLHRLSSIGSVPLAVATAVLAVAPLTHDQWDFPLWIRFSEMASFGGANPAQIWDASPLWAFVPPLFSTITLASYLATGDGSRTLSESFMKVGMAVAYCYSAYAIAEVAPRPLRQFMTVSALLVPLGLYEVAGGYREPFATALALTAFGSIRRGALAFGIILLCAAASISETLLPIVLFPAGVVLAGPGPLPTRALRSSLLAALGIGLFVAEWAYLLPQHAAQHALTYRFGQAPLGAASWAAALKALGMLPAWLPVRSAAFGAALFIAAATLPALRLAALVRTPQHDARRRYVEVLAVFVAFDAAFFVAFRGVDPNTWYTLLAITFYYFALAEPANPFPLLFGSLSGLVFYGILGLGDFVNHALFWPVDRGLLGVLGISTSIFAIVQTAFALSLIVALSSKNAKQLCSTRSTWFFVLFVGAVATSAIRFYLPDFVITVAACTVITLTVARLIEARRLRMSRTPGRALQTFGALTLLCVGALACTRSAAAGITAVGAFVSSFSELGYIDLALALGSILLLVVQQGFGWTSLAGWMVLATTVLWAIVRRVWRNRPNGLNHDEA